MDGAKMDAGGSAVTGQLRDGELLGDYEIVSVAGIGGMGIVYRATQRSLGRVVALKVIREEIARTPEYRDRFLREARLAASVDHPNVVSVYDVGEQDASCSWRCNGSMARTSNVCSSARDDLRPTSGHDRQPARRRIGCGTPRRWSGAP